jgi:PhzF family phenazine biosynthesis protein
LLLVDAMLSVYFVFNRMQVKTFVIDAFTREPFRGNPAGVCLIDSELPVHLMQNIAMELNHSETAFLLHDHGNVYRIRYYTPTTEIAFCGHATLASSKLLLHRVGHQSVTFHTHHGLVLEARSKGDEIEMSFPLYDVASVDPSPDLLEAVGVSHPKFAGFSADLKLSLIEIDDVKDLRSLKPDFNRLRLLDTPAQLLVVTCSSQDDGVDFYSRCFCPWIGIDEDPVTGAAHTVLFPYWSKKLGRKNLTAYQASARGGSMTLSTFNNQLLVLSNATIVLEGVMSL